MGRLSCSFALNVSAHFFSLCFTYVKENAPHSAHSRSNSDKTVRLVEFSSHYNPMSNLKSADGETRTPDPRITNALLYQLSHIGITKLYHKILFCSLEELRQILMLNNMRNRTSMRTGKRFLTSSPIPYNFLHLKQIQISICLHSCLA